MGVAVASRCGETRLADLGRDLGRDLDNLPAAFLPYLIAAKPYLDTDPVPCIRDRPSDFSAIPYSSPRLCSAQRTHTHWTHH